MLFLHPEAAALQEFIAVIASPGHELLFNVFPDRAQTCRVRLFTFKYTVLEFIDTDQVCQVREAVCQMFIAVLIALSFRIEEMIPGLCKEFHGHGMDLIDLGC